jgi:4-hydroxy-tetrahydrodipicolinate synthase
VAKALASVSPDALQVTPVHYLFKPDDESMLRYFGEIADRSGLPVIIYNVIPWSYIPVRLLIRILKEVDGVIGVKQSASDVKALADLIHFVNESGMDHRVRIISAVDPLLYSSFQLGADAAIAAILSAVPEMCVALWEAVQSRNDAEAQALHRRILPVWNAIDGPNLPANVKATMQIRGRAGGYPRSPMPSSSEDQVQRIKDALAAADYSSSYGRILRTFLTSRVQ